MNPHSPYGTYFRIPEVLPKIGEQYHLHSSGIKLSHYTFDKLTPNEQEVKQPFNKFYLQRPDLLP